MDALIESLRRRAWDPSTRTGHSSRVPGAALALYPAASASELAAAEARLGFALPGVLSEVYARIANGGFGPGYGLIGVEGGFADSDGSVVDLYELRRAESPGGSAWPDKLLPICAWGCAIYACVDCSSSAGPVVTFDPGAHHDDDGDGSVFARSHDSLYDWFDEWVRGVNLWDRMYVEDIESGREIENPFTHGKIKVPRLRLRRA